MSIVQPSIATPANASALLQLSKFIPQYMGYSPSQPNTDDKVFREHIQLEWNNCRKMLETSRATISNVAEARKEELDSLITEFDVIESDLRASPTGDFSRKVGNLQSVGHKTLEDLISLDLELVESIQGLKIDLQVWITSDPANQSNFSAIMARITGFRGKYSSRRSLINGVPLNVIRGSPSKKSVKWFQVLSLFVSIAAVGVTIYFNLR